MGTYEDSKIRTARKAYRCNAASLCEIKTGEKYLDYRAGMYNSVRVCMKHAYLYKCAATQTLCETCGVDRARTFCPRPSWLRCEFAGTEPEAISTGSAVE